MEWYYDEMAYGFDFDDTLVNVDLEQGRKDLYLSLDNIKSQNAKMMQLFDFVKQRSPVYILTARHPILRPAISKYLDISPERVFTRTFSLETDEIVESLKTQQNVKDFFDRSNNDKIKKLNTLGWNCRMFLYFDDMYKKLLSAETKLANNVIIFPPAR